MPIEDYKFCIRITDDRVCNNCVFFDLQERLTKVRSVNAQVEAERQKLREELNKCESRSARLEIQRIALEGDLNRLQMILQEKDVQIQVRYFVQSQSRSLLV